MEPAGGGGGAEAAQAFLASVQNRFASQHHIKETSPVFHQFLESVRQVQRQFPARFEFNERFLRQLHYHLYACQFGTFLHNTERERRVGEGAEPARRFVPHGDPRIRTSGDERKHACVSRFGAIYCLYVPPSGA